MPKSFIYNNKENTTVLTLYRDAIGATGLVEDVPNAPDMDVFNREHPKTGYFQKMWDGTKEFLLGKDNIENVGLDYISPRSADNPLFRTAEAKPYASLYDLLYTYQQQKITRTFGSNYDPDILKDHRYTITSLIQHKIIAILQANDEQRESHKTHLANFVTALAKKPELLKTLSDDTHYISLETTLLSTQIILQKEIDSKLFDSEVEAAKEKISQAKIQLTSVINALNNTLLKLTVPANVPLNLKDASWLQYLADNKQFDAVKKGPYGEFIQRFFLHETNDYLPENLSPDDIISTIRDKEAIISNNGLLMHLVELINYRNKLFNLRLRLESSSFDPSNFIIHANLVESIQETTIQMVKKLAAFKDALSTMYLQKGRYHQTELKRNFMSIDWINLRQHFSGFLNGLNDALMRLRLLFNNQPQEPQNDLSLSLSASASALDKSIQLVQALDQSTRHEEDDLYKSFVLLDSDKKSEILEAEKVDLEKSWVEINNDNEDLKQAIGQLKTEKADLIRQNTALRSEVENAKIANANTAQLDRVENAVSALKFFIQQYRERPNCGFFHHHGDKGKLAATKLLADDVEAFREELRTHVVNGGQNFNALLLNAVKRLMNSATLTGNYHPHSLKAYILAYSQFITDPGQDFGKKSPAEQLQFFNKNFTNNVAMQENKEIERQYKVFASAQPAPQADDSKTLRR